MKKFQIVWNGLITMNGSFGISAINQLLCFKELGHYVTIIPNEIKELTAKIPNEIISMCSTRLIAKAGIPIVAIHQGFPEFFNIMDSFPWATLKVGYATNDSDRFKSVGVKYCNEKCDLVFGASDFVTGSAERSGVTVPCHTFHHGVDTDFFYYKEREARKKFTFLLIAERSGRKRIEETCEVFYNLDKDYFDGDAELIVKCFGQSKVDDLLNRYRNTNIIIINGEYTREQIRDLYYRADCFVLATSGDSVGLPYLEAMSTGIPCIATGWGGQIEFTRPEFSFLIDYSLYPSPYLAGMQALPNWGDLAEKFKYCFINRSIVRNYGKAARQYMEKHTWMDGVKDIEKVINKYIDEKEKTD